MRAFERVCVRAPVRLRIRTRVRVCLWARYLEQNTCSNGQLTPLTPAIIIIIITTTASQGGAISYLAGLTNPQPLAGIVGLSTWLPLRHKLSSLTHPHSSSTPVFHGHGSSDQIVQYTFGQRTVEYVKNELKAGEFNAGGKPRGVRFETYRGMAHSACSEEIEHVGEFLEAVVPAE